MIMAISASACQSEPLPTPPSRGFTTKDLLIDPNLLPQGWEVKVEPTDYSFNALGYRKNLGGSAIELKKTNVSTDNTVAGFKDARDAGKAYLDHDHTGNTKGEYAESWEPLTGFTYNSPNADQFRVVCVSIKNRTKIGESCIIEAQYEEFLSIVIYNTSDASSAIDDLETLAKAVDLQMRTFLGEQ